jgi:hypothetical protein
MMIYPCAEVVRLKMKPWFSLYQAGEEIGQFLDFEPRGKRKMQEKLWVQG